MQCCHSPHVAFPPIFRQFIAYLFCRHEQAGRFIGSLPRGEHLTPRACGAEIWPHIPSQATVVTTKGVSLCRASFRRAESLGRFGKTSRKSSAPCACGANAPPRCGAVILQVCQVLVVGRGWQRLFRSWVWVTGCCRWFINGKGYMGLARATMVAVEGINGLVWFNRALGGTRNHFLFFALLFTVLVFLPCQFLPGAEIGSLRCTASTRLKFKIPGTPA